MYREVPNGQVKEVDGTSWPFTWKMWCSYLGQEHTTHAEKCPMQQEWSKGKKNAKKGDKLTGQAKASGSTKHVGESAGTDDKFSLEKAIATLNGYKDLDDMTFFKVQKNCNRVARIFFMTVPDNRKKAWMEFIAKESD
ncbi:hypothetical protein CMV_028052 [Castanea mollissima]|uniref:Uncharacterized protein n=1 Tax=Castanea mollissima TaxID=60419 RepID=A0A8J4Q8H0_9ROSI|nr:hypothetical protein CMV_028052 [Castanea mollissima]